MSNWTNCPHCRKWVQADRHECIEGLKANVQAVYDRIAAWPHGNLARCPERLNIDAECEQVRELERMWRLNV